MKRRELLQTTVAATAALAAPKLLLAQENGANAGTNANLPKTDFKLKYAPHFGMFGQHSGGDVVAQLNWMAERGFTAIEDNGMRGRPVAEQERIAKEMERLKMTMGVFVATADFGNVTFASNDKAKQDAAVKEVKDSLETAKRVNAKWMTVVPGRYDVGREWDYQTAYVVETLKRCAEVCEPAGVIMVLEPLNPWRDHAGLFLSKIPQAYAICQAVGSPSCKILFDMYHQQITEGNIIPNIDRAWSEVAYFQAGDNPGRNEPGTGEMNYRNIFKHIHSKGFQGVVGMEHGNSKRGKEGELAVLQSYIEADKF